MFKVGLLGLGNMGTALIKSWVNIEKVQIYGYDIDKNKVQALQEENQISSLGSLKELAESCEYLVLAVKPYQIEGVLNQIAPYLQEWHCLISIAAGIKRVQLLEWSENRCPVVRVMPNTPALVDAGVFALCLDDPRLEERQQTILRAMFASSGEVHVFSEEYFDAFTALIGSGPAYVFYFLESMIQAGITLGFNRDESKDMLCSLFAGAIKMTQEDSRSVSELKEMVTSPAGTTVQGLNHLERRAVKSAILDALSAACERNRQMGS